MRLSVKGERLLSKPGASTEIDHLPCYNTSQNNGCKIDKQRYMESKWLDRHWNEVFGGYRLYLALPISLTHWGWITHICVSTLTITVSDNGLSPGRRRAIIWTNDAILLIESLGTNLIEIPFCLGLKVLILLSKKFDKNIGKPIYKTKLQMVNFLSRPFAIWLLFFICYNGNGNNYNARYVHRPGKASWY